MKPANRIVLLGASNLTLSLQLIIQLIQQHCGGPSEVFVAAGHGRSYGQNSRVLVRELPGIVQCGLWRQLHSVNTESMLPTYAFLTDVGNDIPYEADPDKILNWVTWCVDRLKMHDARIVMTNLPIASIESLSEIRYNLLRKVMFPSCSLTRNEVVMRARMVHQGLIDLAARRQLAISELDPGLMSFDGIHVAYWKRPVFYRQLLRQFELFEKRDPRSDMELNHNKVASSSQRDRFFLSWQRRPCFAVRRIFGKIERRQQPSGFFKDQTTVSLY